MSKRDHVEERSSFTEKEAKASLKKTYAKKEDAYEVYWLKIKIHGIKRKDLVAKTYIIAMTVLWQEFDINQCVEMAFATDALKLAELLERELSFNFLATLNLEFDKVIS